MAKISEEMMYELQEELDKGRHPKHPMPKHGKSLFRIYRDSLLKRIKERKRA